MDTGAFVGEVIGVLLLGLLAFGRLYLGIIANKNQSSKQLGLFLFLSIVVIGGLVYYVKFQTLMFA
jgi:hypothetical protein